jgi:hypothetical protein
VPTGYDTYRAYRSDWIGQPDTDSTATATAQRNGDGTTTVDAIWNGATQVAEWRVLAGPDADSLSATVPWNGLDTTITVNTTAPTIAVEALDSHGHVIGESARVRA